MPKTDNTFSGNTTVSGGVTPIDYTLLAKKIKQQGQALGFQQIGITDTDLGTHETHFLNWLKRDYHGEMEYMARHGTRRSRPQALEPGTLRVISARMDYLPAHVASAEATLSDNNLAYVSRYALGRDYHKLLRKRLQKLADYISAEIDTAANNPNKGNDFCYRVFVDSAPVLEKALAEKAGLGWIGKHSNLLSREAGSWFFLAELYTNLPLPCDAPPAVSASLVSKATDPGQANNHCGKCSACIDACPTQAIVAPYQVDARRCISYLTIELRSSIPIAFRKAMGNRIYGCDDCQLVCPWNRFATTTGEADFEPRHALDCTALTTLFAWTETMFLRRFEGSPIRRIGYQCWLRNIAVALGNASDSAMAIEALNKRKGCESPMVNEHIDWALDQHRK